MKIIDFSRSFVTFRIDVTKKPPKTVTSKPPFSLNNARIQLDSICWITERSTGWTGRYLHGANCKTERVGVSSGIWNEPNADFVPIFSEEAYLNLKTYARAGVAIPLYPPGSGMQQERQSGCSAETFDSVRFNLVERRGIPLETPEQIIAAVLEGHPLMASTEFETDRYGVRLDYPVKTINVSERDGIFQTDTGPHLFPDSTRNPQDLLANFELAFSAFNQFDWIEMLVRVPTEIASGILVQHYSKTVRLEQVRNRLFRLTEG